ncbi:GNAT family N-acetyltransferase [Ferrimonas pelagia]
MATETEATPLIRHLAAEELRIAASILLNAYKDDPFFRAVFPAQEYEQRLRAAIREELQELWQRQQGFIGLELDGALIAVACLSDGHYPLGQARFWNWRLKMALGTGWHGARQWMAREQEIMAQLADEHTDLLQFVAVSPGYQRRGFGEALLRSVVTTQREAGRHALATLNYWPELTTLFERLGFRSVAAIHVGQVEGRLCRVEMSEL